MTLAQALCLASVPALLLAALHDIALRRIPDQVSVLVALCGLGARLASGDALFSVALAIPLFAALFACWQRGFLGGGDVKLLTASSLLAPAGSALDLLLAVAVAGGVLAMAYLLGRRLRPPTLHLHGAFLGRLCRIERWRMRRGAPLPYACAIAAGCVFILVKG